MAIFNNKKNEGANAVETNEEVKTDEAVVSNEDAKDETIKIEEPKKDEVEEVKTENTKSKEPKKYVVKTPVPNYNGIVAGVQFAYGKSAVELQDGWILEWFKENGYVIEEVK